MAGVEQISLVNYVSASVVASVTSEDAAWLSVNVLRPEEPLAAWRSVGVGASGFVLNLGAALTIGFVGLVNVNASLVHLAAASDAAITANVVSANDLVPLQTVSGRRQLGYVWGAAPARQYLRVTFPAQTPTDGAAYLMCGGVWAGPVAALPVSPRTELTFRRQEPVRDVRALGTGSLSRLQVGEPFVELSGQIFGAITPTALGVADEWGAWQTLDQQIWAAGVVGLFLNRGNAGHFWPVRRTSAPSWAVSVPHARGAVAFEEVIHP